MADKKAQIEDRGLANDLRNLQSMVRRAKAGDEASAQLTPVSKTWAFQGHLGRTVLVDRRDPAPFDRSNPRYMASSWRVGERATEINPISGQHSYNTGNLYRTVHWKEETFGLNGRFTKGLAGPGPWRHEGLNCSPPAKAL
mmetsp:Transcript_3679/g.11095  ORF Transcript_3679/g.11095 Transcript_3679/m.11095 type:complete len:141 (+) Transcript_3679:23-445(+)